MQRTPLAGKTILVTRPAEQADRISRLIREAGGKAVVFPAIAILPPSEPARLDAVLARLESFDLAIFVSPTAVARVFERLGPHRQWPQRLPAAAVGQGSARALSAYGVSRIIAPTDGADSEALLALPELQGVAGRRIVIFRGEGGRALLAETLTARGATVEFAECYRRAKPDADPAPLLENHARQPFSALILTSRESLANLRELLGAAWDRFADVPAFVPHERIAAAARQAGLCKVELAPGGDAGTLQAMIKYFRS